MFKFYLLGLQNVHLHPVQEHLVVKLNDVNLLGIFGRRIQRDLDVDPRNATRFHYVQLPAASLRQSLLIDLLVGINDIVEPRLVVSIESLLSIAIHIWCVSRIDLDRIRVNFTYTIDRAHNYLIEMSTNQQVRLLAECDLDNTPNELANLLVYAESLAHVKDGLSCHLKHSIEEHLQWS